MASHEGTQTAVNNRAIIAPSATMPHLHERMSLLLLPCAKQVPEDRRPQEKDPFSEEEKIVKPGNRWKLETTDEAKRVLQSLLRLWREFELGVVMKLEIDTEQALRRETRAGRPAVTSEDEEEHWDVRTTRAPLLHWEEAALFKSDKRERWRMLCGESGGFNQRPVGPLPEGAPLFNSLERQSPPPPAFIACLSFCQAIPLQSASSQGELASEVEMKLWLEEQPEAVGSLKDEGPLQLPSLTHSITIRDGRAVQRESTNSPVGTHHLLQDPQDQQTCIPRYKDGDKERVLSVSRDSRGCWNFSFSLKGISAATDVSWTEIACWDLCGLQRHLSVTVETQLSAAGRTASGVKQTSEQIRQEKKVN
ncbi:hypothetical protein DNTS_008364 [Danionella cerebrum]|uniref:Uncharacterized protein n=1 Tax=Danionella cerebrum TaxID=2873325 RepID=A0A553NGG1_9TELE|nr:hypothetical protein DNTS_008364 [Danionella translucida]